MALNPALLGAAFVAGVAPTDPLGIADWLALGAPFCTYALTVVANPLGGTPLIAAGPIIAGTGAFICPPSPPLGLLLAATALTVDVPGIDKWLLVADHFVNTLQNTGTIDASTLVAYTGPIPPPTGPVTGIGKIALPVDFDFATALSVTDTPGKAKWKAVGDALKAHLTTFAIITPTMINPAPAGPVTGTGAIS